MSKVKFTAGRVAAHECEPGKSQSFLWSIDAPGLGLRAAASGGKSYIFQAKLNGQAIRITIGDPKTWSIAEAEAEARRLKILIDAGKDPRQVKADALAAEQAARDAKAAEAAAKQAQQFRESVTLGKAWADYVADRSPHWSELHRRDHDRII